MLSEVEQELAQSTADNVLPGLVASMCTASSSPYYFSTGLASQESGETRLISPDFVSNVASCTKLLTSIATLQCVQRGLITLDTPVRSVLPQFDGSHVLTGFDQDEKPLLRPAASPVLVRHLLTHTCGLAYEQLQPLVPQWFLSQGLDAAQLRGKEDKLHGVPLLSDPGEEWSYGQGLDWAGILVRQLTDTRQVGEYFCHHIFQPLGITVAGYREESIQLSPEELKRRRVQPTTRNADGTLVASPSPAFLGPDTPDNGGAGLFITPREYLKVLNSLLRNDGVLLDPEMCREWCFTPQLTPSSRVHRTLLGQLANSAWGALMGAGLPPPNAADPEGDKVEFNHSLIGLLSRKRGETNWIASWCGLGNLFWTIDSEEGIATYWCMQLAPPGDQLALEWYRKWLEAAREESKEAH